MNYLKIGYAFILLIILNWFVSIMPFDGYLGKLISLILLVMIASNNTFLGIVGVAVMHCPKLIVRLQVVHNSSLVSRSNMKTCFLVLVKKKLRQFLLPWYR